MESAKTNGSTHCAVFHMTTEKSIDHVPSITADAFALCSEPSKQFSFRFLMANTMGHKCHISHGPFHLVIIIPKKRCIDLLSKAVKPSINAGRFFLLFQFLKIHLKFSPLC